METTLNPRGIFCDEPFESFINFTGIETLACELAFQIFQIAGDALGDTIGRPLFQLDFVSGDFFSDVDRLGGYKDFDHGNLAALRALCLHPVANPDGSNRATHTGY